MSDDARKTVLLTRSAPDNAAWARELDRRGFGAVDAACLGERALDPPADLAALLERADWLACTSRRGVDALAALHATLPDTLRLAAVGPATAERLHTTFGRCDLVSERGHGFDLARALVAAKAQRPVVVAARGGLDDVEETLRSAGVRAERVELYETGALDGALPAEAASADAVFFASPSAVRAFVARGALPAGCAVVSIGPSTSAALRELDLPVHAESRTRDLSGMISALESLSTSER